MNHVEVDDSVEHFAANEAKWSVDSGQGSVQECPSLGFVVMAVWVCVVQVSDSH